jgi:hypothetical protein
MWAIEKKEARKEAEWAVDEEPAPGQQESGNRCVRENHIQFSIIEVEGP